MKNPGLSIVWNFPVFLASLHSSRDGQIGWKNGNSADFDNLKIFSF
jgi:hypothetical protein